MGSHFEFTIFRSFLTQKSLKRSEIYSYFSVNEKILFFDGFSFYRDLVPFLARCSLGSLMLFLGDLIVFPTYINRNQRRTWPTGFHRSILKTERRLSIVIVSNATFPSRHVLIIVVYAIVAF